MSTAKAPAAPSGGICEKIDLNDLIDHCHAMISKRNTCKTYLKNIQTGCCCLVPPFEVKGTSTIAQYPELTKKIKLKSIVWIIVS